MAKRVVKPDTDVMQGLRHLQRMVVQLRNEVKNMATALEQAIARAEASITPLSDAVTAELALLTQIVQMLRDAVAAGGNAAELSARVGAVADSIDANKQRLVDATVANTPAAP